MVVFSVFVVLKPKNKVVFVLFVFPSVIHKGGFCWCVFKSQEVCFL